MPDPPFPDHVGAARRPTRADRCAVVRACYGGWRTNLLRGRFGRLVASFPLLVAGIGLASYAVAPAGMTTPTGWFGLPLAAWFLVVTLAWTGLALVEPAVTGVLVVRRTPSAVSYVLDGAAGEPALLSVIRLRRVSSGLTVENHAAAQPGRGWGRRLRAELGEHLLAVCDGRGWTLHVVAVSSGMADAYCAELDGMLRGPRSWFHRMTGAHPIERRPQPVRVAPAAPQSPG